MDILFYNLSKRENSTLRPSGAGDSRSVFLKEGTSIYNPTFIMADDVTEYNYCQWGSRYYYELRMFQHSHFMQAVASMMGSRMIDYPLLIQRQCLHLHWPSSTAELLTGHTSFNMRPALRLKVHVVYCGYPMSTLRSLPRR